MAPEESMTEGTGNQSAPPDPARPHFYDELAKFVPREKLVPFIRLTSRGVFVEKDELPVIFDAYQSWQKKVRENGEAISAEKIRKRLLGSEALPLLYLVEGKKCLVGYLLPNSVPRPGGGKQIPNTGTLFDPHTYLDVRDPIFAKLEGVFLKTTSLEGIVIQFETKRTMYQCGPDLIKRFAEFCRHSPPLLKEFPETKESLRDCLLPLRRLLEKSRPHAGKQPLLVPMEFNRNNFQFLQYRSLIIVVQEKKLVSFYDLKGRGETLFIRSQLSQLGGNQGELSKVRGYSAATEKSFHLGKIWYHGMSFLLHPDAFRQYMRIHSSPRSKKPLPPKYTVLQVMTQLVPAFIRSQVLDDATVRKLPVRMRPAGAKFRRFSNLVFIITDKNVLSSCIEFRSENVRGENGRREDGRHRPESQRNEGSPSLGSSNKRTRDERPRRERRRNHPRSARPISNEG